MIFQNAFVSLEIGSLAYTQTCLAQSLTNNKFYQHDYSGSRNYAGTPCICHQSMGHKNGHLIITHPQITILTSKQQQKQRNIKKQKNKRKNNLYE